VSHGTARRCSEGPDDCMHTPRNSAREHMQVENVGGPGQGPISPATSDGAPGAVPETAIRSVRVWPFALEASCRPSSPSAIARGEAAWAEIVTNGALCDCRTRALLAVAR
jgi:hypothetical protein